MKVFDLSPGGESDANGLSNGFNGMTGLERSPSAGMRVRMLTLVIELPYSSSLGDTQVRMQK